MRFVKIIAGECVLFLRTLTILHLHMYRKTVQHFESEESIGNVCVHITNTLFFEGHTKLFLILLCRYTLHGHD